MCSSENQTKDIHKGVVRWIIREVFGVVLVGLTLFLSAGMIFWRDML